MNPELDVLCSWWGISDIFLDSKIAFSFRTSNHCGTYLEKMFFLCLSACAAALSAKCSGYTVAQDMVKGHDISGKTVLITGGDSGIGFETAKAIEQENATIIIASLFPGTTGADAKQNITSSTGNYKVQ